MKDIKIQFLKITNFRNYSNLSIELNPSFNLITGLNGAGKTSILEAVYYLSTGKSYFTHQDKFVYKNGEDFFRIEGLFNDGNDVKIEIVSSVKQKKSYKIDQNAIKSILELLGRMPSFIIAPKDIQILMDSSIERRKVIDRTIAQSSREYLLNLMQYNKLLSQRNAYLKNCFKTRKRDALLLQSLDTGLIQPANLIYKHRSEFIDEIKPIFQKLYNDLSGSNEVVSIEYRSHLKSEDMSMLLFNSLDRDYITGKSNVGIHRDDLIFTIQDTPIKKYASQGQLKTAVIAIKLAQLMWFKNISGKNPILLLDDIFDKLDESRVYKVLDICNNELNTQVIITDTQEERVKSKLDELNIEFNHYTITNGSLHE